MAAGRRASSTALGPGRDRWARGGRCGPVGSERLPVGYFVAGAGSRVDLQPRARAGSGLEQGWEQRSDSKGGASATAGREPPRLPPQRVIRTEHGPEEPPYPRPAGLLGREPLRVARGIDLRSRVPQRPVRLAGQCCIGQSLSYARSTHYAGHADDAQRRGRRHDPAGAPDRGVQVRLRGLFPCLEPRLRRPSRRGRSRPPVRLLLPEPLPHCRPEGTAGRDVSGLPEPTGTSGTDQGRHCAGRLDCRNELCAQAARLTYGLIDTWARSGPQQRYLAAGFGCESECEPFTLLPERRQAEPPGQVRATCRSTDSGMAPSGGRTLCWSGCDG